MAKSKHIEHLPVMCEAATDALLVGGGGVFVDATFGGGGHSKAILRKIPADSSLIALDCDEFAEEHAAGVGDKRFQFFRRNFSSCRRCWPKLVCKRCEACFLTWVFRLCNWLAPSAAFLFKGRGTWT